MPRKSLIAGFAVIDSINFKKLLLILQIKVRVEMDFDLTECSECTKATFKLALVRLLSCVCAQVDFQVCSSREFFKTENTAMLIRFFFL
jgi:hypothetical protein